MAFKFIAFFAIVSVAAAGILPAYEHASVHHEAPANYDFNYEVHDTHTGDIKRQHEKAENGHVSGQYSLVDPDGYRRVVSKKIYLSLKTPI